MLVEKVCGALAQESNSRHKIVSLISSWHLKIEPVDA